MSSLSSNLRLLFPFLWKGKSTKHKWSIILTLFVVCLTIFFNLSAPLIFKKIIHALDNDSEKNHVYTVMLFITYGILWTSGRFFEKTREMIFFKPVSTAITDYCLTVFKHIHALSLHFHLGRETGKIAGAIQNSQLAIAMILTNIFFRILPVFIEALLAFFILWHVVGLQIGLIVIVILISYLIINYFIMDVFKKADKIYEDLNIIVDKRVVDSLLNIENIKYLGAQAFEAEQVNLLLRKREDAIIKVFWSGTFTTVIQALLLGTGLTIISYIMAQNILNEKLEISDFVLVNGYLLLLLNPLESITGFIRNTLSHSAQLEHSILLLRESHIIQDISNAPEIKINKASIQFKDVCFSYNHENHAVLKDFNLFIPGGKTTAIVGSSGSGKSTLSRLILRFYDINSGLITIDNQDIQKVTKKSLRKHIAVVPQDIVLLNKSLKYNITYGNLNASNAEINQVIHSVHLDSLISQLPDGLETLVGERGVKLSGGEKQRIAIARALLKKPKILIFDEATSSLDTNTEKTVQQNIEEVTKNITTILIAHRLSTVVHSDNIVVMNKGIIAEQGTHQALLDQGGLYAQLWATQYDKK